jgi:hypothetical protein
VFYWRKIAKVGRVRKDVPGIDVFRAIQDGRWVPESCSVHPERVLVYPDYDDLAELAGPQMSGIRQKIRAIDVTGADLQERVSSEYGPRDGESLYSCELGPCSGSALGGRPPIKRDGKVFEHFLTISSCELDSGSFRRWMPLEDQRRFAKLGTQLTWQRLFEDCDSDQISALQETTGMELGRTQRMYVYVFRKDVPWSVFTYVND